MFTTTITEQTGSRDEYCVGWTSIHLREPMCTTTQYWKRVSVGVAPHDVCGCVVNAITEKRTPCHDVQEAVVVVLLPLCDDVIGRPIRAFVRFL